MFARKISIHLNGSCLRWNIGQRGLKCLIRSKAANVQS